MHDTLHELRLNSSTHRELPPTQRPREILETVFRRFSPASAIAILAVAFSFLAGFWTDVAVAAEDEDPSRFFAVEKWDGTITVNASGSRYWAVHDMFETASYRNSVNLKFKGGTRTEGFNEAGHVNSVTWRFAATGTFDRYLHERFEQEDYDESIVFREYIVQGTGPILPESWVELEISEYSCTLRTYAWGTMLQQGIWGIDDVVVGSGSVYEPWEVFREPTERYFALELPSTGLEISGTNTQKPYDMELGGHSTITWSIKPAEEDDANKAPSFTKGSDQTIAKNSGARTVENWATNILPGPDSEAGQIVDFIVANDNNALFAVQPAITSDGTLSFTPATGAIGTAKVTVKLHDNGGTANGGVDTSAEQSFTIEVNKTEFKIAQLELNDIDWSTLKYLSVSNQNPYFGGKTRIRGSLIIQGPQQDSLESLVLEILVNGVVTATAELSPDAREQLLQPFDATELLKFGPRVLRRADGDTSPILFELTSAQANNINQTQDGKLQLQVRAKSRKGGEHVKVFGLVDKLVRYTAGNRYGEGRDDVYGGDDWVKPSVKAVVDYFNNRYGGFLWGDFSNMNGGPFPPHKSHDVGVDADGYFDGYYQTATVNGKPVRLVTVAAMRKLIEYCNDATMGSRITDVWVTYNDDIRKALPTLPKIRGKAASTVIQNASGHDGHFHWRIAPAN